MTWNKKVRSRWNDPLSRVGWQGFETLLADYYRGQGYRVEHVGTGGSKSRFDGGIDLKLRKGEEYIVVQCKHWNAEQVPHNAMHELLGIMITESATGAILITSGEFTAYAREAAAKQGHVQLIDGNALRAMIGPIPEPKAAFSDYDSRLDAVASALGKGFVSAVETRIRGGRPARPPYAPIAKFMLFLLFLGFMLIVMKNIVEGIQIHPPGSAARNAAQIEANQPLQPQALPYVQRSPAINVSPITSATPAGYPKPTMFAPTSTVPTTDEGMREWKRKNAESMKILDKTTPELKQ